MYVCLSFNTRRSNTLVTPQSQEGDLDRGPPPAAARGQEHGVPEIRPSRPELIRKVSNIGPWLDARARSRVCADVR